MASFPQEGGCDCGKVRYSIETPPFCYHACHCLWCQRETGSAFALNAAIEKDRVKLLNNSKLDWSQLPSQSGKGQYLARCSDCKVALVSIYGDDFNKPHWVIRAGTLDNPDVLSPYLTAHIFTSTKQSWLKLDGKVPAFGENYNVNDVWTAEQLERYRKLHGNEPGRW